MLGHLIQVSDSGIHARDTGALYHRGIGDFANHIGYAGHGLHDVGHRGASFSYQASSRFHFVHRGTNQRLYLPRCLSTAARQAAHLASHHGKTPALLTRAGGFYCRIQRQDVGLKRYAINHADNFGNLLAAGVDLLHRRNYLAHHFASALRHHGGIGGQGAGLACAVGTVLYRAGERVHAGGCGLQVAGSLFRALGQIVVASGNFGAGDSDVFGAAAHLRHRGAQRHIHGAQ